MAVQLHMTIVSMNTPRACVSPARTGVSHSAAAAAHGAEPEPASFEKSPLFYHKKPSLEFTTIIQYISKEGYKS